MVGAGISFPSVPLANEIVSQCKVTASEYGRSGEPKTQDPLNLYSHWFETAYGEPNQRQGYLRKLIEEKQITHANFRLAHLLLNDKISNIVVTTNFDDFLSKALTLFGKRHIVCDHPQTVGRINYAEPDLQIVHLHGTYWFYDCCNLRGEIQDRSQQSQRTTSTMAALLDMILWSRSPLVVGYSGWEGDVFMNAFQRRLASPLGSNAYWFTFRRDLLDSMPPWLKHHPNVRFVVPSEPAARTADAKLSSESATATSEVRQTEASGLPAIRDTVPLLPADRVLDALIRAFDLELPRLTKDPLGFFAEQLDKSLPKDEASDKDADIYAIKNVVERIKRAKQKELAEPVTATAELLESAFEEIRDALRRADYRQAIQLACQVSLSGLSVERLNELAEAAWLAAFKLYDNSAEEISAYDLFVEISDKLAALRPDPNSSNNARVAQALVNKGVTLGDIEEALTVYDQVVQRYGDAPESALCEQVARALINKGVTLGALNRSEEALTVYDQVVRRYGDSPAPTLRELVARSLLNKGVRLGELNRPEEELALYDQVVERFGDAPEPALGERVAKALFNKGVTLGALNRNEEALTAYDEVLRRFDNAPELALRELVAKTLVNKGVKLVGVNRSEEALQTYEQVVQRFGEAPEPTLRKRVASALNGIGFQSLIDAKDFRLKNDENSAREKFRKAQESLTAAGEREPDNPVILGNLAYLAFLSGRKDESRELLRRAISLGGEKIRQGELEDASINPLPEDDEFCDLVRSIPVPPAAPTA